MAVSTLAIRPHTYACRIATRCSGPPGPSGRVFAPPGVVGQKSGGHSVHSLRHTSRSSQKLAAKRENRPPLVEVADSTEEFDNYRNELLNSGLGASGIDGLQKCFPQQFDAFQRRSLEHLLEGKNVVVSAPTGSGKTLIAEAAIVAALSSGKRVFYTTPLKALSNQKLREFRARFGESKVGLRTGDAAVNRDAPLIVLTTEILRNMLYGAAGGAAAEDGGVAADDRLAGVSFIVLDEVHYLSDSERGTVWEETIIYCPKDIQMLALSATVGNPGDLQGWISRVHGPTEVVTSNWRPVPLTFYYARRPMRDGDLPEWTSLIGPLLNKRRDGQNYALIPRSVGRENSAEMSRSLRYSTPSLPEVIDALRDEKMLPAVCFIFSRARCDAAVEDMTRSRLTTRAEAAKIRDALKELQDTNPAAVRAGATEPLLRGFASHHAGCLPAWKQFVEELFQKNLLKVVFSTETLAAGINMPARTAVLVSMSKRDSNGPRLLKNNEFMQMAGRAGRRGFDTTGSVVVMQTAYEGPDTAAALALGTPEALESQFSVSYAMVANLLRSRTLAQAKTIVDSSFGNYISSVYREGLMQDLESLNFELEALLAEEPRDADELARRAEQLDKLRGRLKEEQRLLDILEEQAAWEQDAEAEAYLGEARARYAALAKGVADLESKDPSQKEAMLLAQRRKQAIKAVKKRIGRLEREMGDREPRSWYSFQAAMRVLQRSGALTSDPTPVLTPLGEAVSSVRAVNELWQGLVLLSQELDTLEPAALAGVVAALLAPECINRPTAFSSFPAGSESMEALQRLAPIADKVLEIQDEEGFEAPLLVNAGFSGLVEMWAEGGTWEEICKATNMDEGDVARLLRRVADYLTQVPQVPHVTEALRTNAREARILLDRPPISELVG